MAKRYAKRINGSHGRYNHGDVFPILEKNLPLRQLTDMDGYHHSEEFCEVMPIGYDPELTRAATIHPAQRIFKTANASQIIAMDFAAVEAKVTAYVMSKDELFALHSSTTAACLEVMKKKNHDYTSGGYVFANFKDSSILGISPVMGILLRCIDKFKRIQTHCTKGKLVVEGEGVLDAVDDVINYMILAKGMLIEESKNNA